MLKILFPFSNYNITNVIEPKNLKFSMYGLGSVWPTYGQRSLCHEAFQNWSILPLSMPESAYSMNMEAQLRAEELGNLEIYLMKVKRIATGEVFW